MNNSYSEIKDKLMEVLKDKRELNRRLQLCEKEIVEIKQISEDTENKFLEDKKSAYKEELREEIAKGTKEIRLNISRLEKEIHQKELNFNNLLRSKDFEKILKQLKEESFTNDLEELFSEQEAKILKVIGEEKLSKLSKYISNGSHKPNKREIQDSLNYLKQTEIKESKLDRVLPNLVDKLGEHTDKLYKVVSRDVKTSVSSLVAMGVLFYFAAPVVMGVASLGMVVTSGVAYRNAKTFIKTSRSFEIAKSVKDLEKDLEKKAKEIQLQEDRKLQAQKKTVLDKLSCSLEKEKESLILKTNKIESEFRFDDTNLNKNLHITLENYKGKLNSLFQEKNALEVKVSSIEKQVNELTIQLDKEVSTLRDSYLNLEKIGTGHTMFKELLIDIKDNTPVFHKISGGLTIYLYEDYELVKAFINLFTVQLRTQINPYLFNSVLWDMDTLGTHFKSLESDKYSNPFEIIFSPEDFAETKNKLLELRKKRYSGVLKVASDLDEYNKQMAESDSVCETFIHNFILSHPSNFFSDESLLSMLKISGKLGIYFHMFIFRDDVGDLKDELIDVASEIYDIKERGIIRFSQERVKEMILLSKK